MLTLDLRLTIRANTNSQLKSELWRTLPNVKSSHRVEAAAKSLGFATHAALLAATNRAAIEFAPADCAKFIGYLAERGYRTDQSRFHIAVGRVAMRDVMARERRLCIRGIGPGRPQRKDDGAWETPYEHYDRFNRDRHELLMEARIEEFFRGVVLMQHLIPTKTINRRIGSYNLKHIAETVACRFPDGRALGPHYVSNGALIAAAIHCGFKHRVYLDHLGYEEINASFNVSQISIDDVLLRILPRRLGVRARWRAELRANKKQRADGKGN